jgi:5-hydroxyisourate hydrolase
MALGMKKVSTHILDVMRGTPASGVPVQLEQQDTSGNWRALGSGVTDRDGRCVQLLTRDELLPGLYRLSFDTASYFNTHKIAGLYPTVTVTFQVREGESQFHIPLLLSANGYTTYRGS